MEKFIFILGRDPELSKQELLSYLESRNIKHQILETSDVASILELPSINAANMIKDLAGIQKIAKIIDSFDHLYDGKKNKVRFAISNYTPDEVDLREDLKSYFKKERIKATIKKSHHQEQEFLTPSEAQNVVEILQYKGNIAKTIAVFNPKEYKFRDTQRPQQRPMHTISIRLAKILINLSGVKPGQTLFDPFCGIGTVLQEAMLMGIDVIGMDKDKYCIDASKANLDWVKKHYNPSSTYRLISGDARNAAQLISSVDCVATEPYMGPFIKGYPTDQQARRIQQDLMVLYSEVLYGLLKITKKRIVFITPRFRTKTKKEVPMNLKPLLEKRNLSYQGPFLYSSPTSKMLREIWVINKA